MKAIGIDLGTNNSCVGVVHNGVVEILTNNYDLRTTPSVVGFLDGCKIVGEEAKESMEFENVITCSKRLIGRKFDDEKVQAFMQKVPYKIVNKNGYAAIQVQINGRPRTYMPEDIAHYILLGMKKIAAIFLGLHENDEVAAVITVPAYFTDAQRKATIDAAKFAKLKLLRIINEPTAAALAYGYKNKWREGILLVYDLGGGTFDVSIIKITKGICEVLAVDGDDHLGGEDFDNILVNYCVQYFLNQTGHDISSDAEAMSKVKAKCEQMKKKLSYEKVASIEIQNLYGDENFRLKNYKRDKFDSLAALLVERTLKSVENAIEKVKENNEKFTKDSVDHVILVGGSTKIPLIRQKLKEFFNGKDIKCDIKSDEAVAYGATLMAEYMRIQLDEDGNHQMFNTSIRNIRLIDIIPRSLGTDLYTDINDKNGYYNIVAKRCTKIPFVKKSHCTTLHDNQEEMDFVVYEGEEPLLANNVKLDKFTLKNIPRARQGVPRIEITFKVDDSGVLTVSAADKRKGVSEVIEIRPDKGRLSDEKIVEMIYELEDSDVIEIDDD